MTKKAFVYRIISLAYDDIQKTINYGESINITEYNRVEGSRLFIPNHRCGTAR